MLRKRKSEGCEGCVRNRVVGRRAFTMVELLVVMTLVVFIMGILVAGITIVNQKIGETQCKALIDGISLALENYKKKVGYYPPSSPPIFQSYVKDYGSLMVKIRDDQLDFSDFLPNVEKMKVDGTLGQTSAGSNYYKLRDTYTNRIYYQAPGIHNRTSFDLCSAGPDGDIEETTDNINNWDE